MTYQAALPPVVHRPRRSARARAKDEAVNGFGVASWAVARSVLIVAATLLVLALGPTLLGCRALVVVSGSMAPHVLVGDVLVTEPLGDHVPRRGQILVVEDPAHPGRLVSHRLVRINADGTLKLRGDANKNADSAPVPRQAVRGIAMLRVPLIGWPAVWAQQAASVPLGLTAVLALAVGLQGLRPRPSRLTAPSERPARRAGRHRAPGSHRGGRGRRVAAGRPRVFRRTRTRVPSGSRRRATTARARISSRAEDRGGDVGHPSPVALIAAGDRRSRRGGQGNRVAQAPAEAPIAAGSVVAVDYAR